VVLLEIGYWMAAAAILQSRQGMDGSPYDHLHETARMALPSWVGSKYKQATCACLDWEEDENEAEAGLGAEKFANTWQL
jgi:hypothetical protein